MFRRRRVGELQGILAQSQEETSSTFSGILLIDLTTLKLGIGRFKKMFANKDFLNIKIEIDFLFSGQTKQEMASQELADIIAGKKMVFFKNFRIVSLTVFHKASTTLPTGGFEVKVYKNSKYTEYLALQWCGEF